MNAARSATCVCLVGLCFPCPYSLGLLTACAQWRFLPHTFLPFCCLFLFLRAWGWGKATWKETGRGGELRTFQSFISVISIIRRIEPRKEEKEWGWIFPCYLGREREAAVRLFAARERLITALRFLPLGAIRALPKIFPAKQMTASWSLAKSTCASCWV